jgi:hypothetical protein
MARPKTTDTGGCRYRDDSDAICKQLAQLISERDAATLQEFSEQNKVIREHNHQVIDLLTSQGDLMREVRIDLNNNVKPQIALLIKDGQNRERRLRILENTIGIKWKIASVAFTVLFSVGIILGILFKIKVL